MWPDEAVVGLRGSALRIDIADITNRVIYYKERVVLTRHGRPVAALMPLEDLEKLKEIEQDERTVSKRHSRRRRAA